MLRKAIALWNLGGVLMEDMLLQQGALQGT